MASVKGYSITEHNKHRGHEGEPLATVKVWREGRLVLTYIEQDWGGGQDIIWNEKQELHEGRMQEATTETDLDMAIIVLVEEIRNLNGNEKRYNKMSATYPIMATFVQYVQCGNSRIPSREAILNLMQESQIEAERAKLEPKGFELTRIFKSKDDFNVEGAKRS